MDRNQFCKYSTCPSREFFSGFQWQSSVLTGVHANECWELRYAWPANGGSKGGDEDVTFCEKNIKKVKYKRKAGRERESEMGRGMVLTRATYVVGGNKSGGSVGTGRREDASLEKCTL